MKLGKVSEILYDVDPFSLVKMPLPDEVATIEYIFSGSSNSNKKYHEYDLTLICYNQCSWHLAVVLFIIGFSECYIG